MSIFEKIIYMKLHSLLFFAKNTNKPKTNLKALKTSKLVLIQIVCCHVNKSECIIQHMNTFCPKYALSMTNHIKDAPPLIVVLK